MVESASPVAYSALLLGGEVAICRMGLGASRLPSDRARGLARDAEVSREVLRRAVALGVNHIDTANFYRSGDGSVRANGLIRDALHPYPDNLLIATKVGPIFTADGPRQGDASELRGLVEDNLESLGVDCLDLVYLRIGMMEVPHEESIAERFEALAALREEGLIRYLGLSNVDNQHLAEAQKIAPVVAVQNDFHFAKRDAAVLDACTAAGIAYAPFHPLGGGSANLDVGPLSEVASRHGATIAQVRLAWLLSLSPVVLAIPGMGSVIHLEENLAAMSVTLTDEDMELLNH